MLTWQEPRIAYRGRREASTAAPPAAHRPFFSELSGGDRLAVAPRLAARDRHVVDLVRPVGDLEDARDRVELGQQVVLGDARAAVGLDRSVDDPRCDLGRGDLDGRHLDTRAAV